MGFVPCAQQVSRAMCHTAQEVSPSINETPQQSFGKSNIASPENESRRKFKKPKFVVSGSYSMTHTGCDRQK